MKTETKTTLNLSVKRLSGMKSISTVAMPFCMADRGSPSPAGQTQRPAGAVSPWLQELREGIGMSA